MKFKRIVFWTLLLSSFLWGSDHGIFLKTNQNVNGAIDSVNKVISQAFLSSGYEILYNDYVKSPDYVRQDSEDHCGFKAKIIVMKYQNYVEMISSYGSKYLVAAFLRIGIYETPTGVNVNIVDPETINRIVFNDLYENDEEQKYFEVITKTKKFKQEIVDILHKTIDAEDVEEPMEPIRDDEDLAESSKDMFMMVGSLTLFNDEDQFPIIYKLTNPNGFDGLHELKKKFISNLNSFQPNEHDKEYRWHPIDSDLKWKVVSEIISPKKDAILLGITRPRTEAVSFNIAGSSREDEGNMCPGLDHASAYPIEVLLIQEDENICVYTQREMHRMDMYFWDAGMAAFMNHMSMPGILDESIKKALLGK